MPNDLIIGTTHSLEVVYKHVPFPARYTFPACKTIKQSRLFSGKCFDAIHNLSTKVRLSMNQTHNMCDTYGLHQL